MQAEQIGWDLDRPVRKLSDGEIVALRNDAPSHLAALVGSFFQWCIPADVNYSTLQFLANRYIEDNKMDPTTQALVWRGVELMATFYNCEKVRSNVQLSLL